MEPWEVGRKILELEDDAQEEMDYRVGDSAMWNKVGGPTIAEYFEDAGDDYGIPFTMEKSKKSRENNYVLVRQRIDGFDGDPMLYITANCKHAWRTLPDLQLDEPNTVVAIDPDECTFAQYRQAVGTAWSSDDREVLKKVVCAIGKK